MRKVLFVDRDGTLIEEPEDFQVDSLEKLRLVKGVIPALVELTRAGYFLVIVTNQDGLGSTSYPLDTFAKVNDKMMDLFSSQGVSFESTLICPHTERDGCACRKPRLELLTHYLRDQSIDWSRSAVVGDRKTDLMLAESLGVRGFQLSTGGGEWSWAQIVAELLLSPRKAKVSRRSLETKVDIEVNLDGVGVSNVATGLGFFDHMLEQLAKHSSIDLVVKVDGDSHIDDHHTVEDTGIALGEAMKSALSDKVGIGRYGFALPMDECRAEALLDLSGRSITKIDLPFTCARLGDLSTEMIPHFFQSWSMAAGGNLHLTVRGDNNHHIAESAFKCFARALRQACAINVKNGLPTTKGIL